MSSDGSAKRRKKHCVECNSTSTVLWRKGPQGPKTLCNKCGLAWSKRQRKEAEERNGGAPATQNRPEGRKNAPSPSLERTSETVQYILHGKPLLLAENLVLKDTPGALIVLPKDMDMAGADTPHQFQVYHPNTITSARQALESSPAYQPPPTNPMASPFPEYNNMYAATNMRSQIPSFSAQPRSEANVSPLLHMGLSAESNKRTWSETQQMTSLSTSLPAMNNNFSMAMNPNPVYNHLPLPYGAAPSTSMAMTSAAMSPSMIVASPTTSALPPAVNYSSADISPTEMNTNSVNSSSSKFADISNPSSPQSQTGGLNFHQTAPMTMSDFEPNFLAPSWSSQMGGEHAWSMPSGTVSAAEESRFASSMNLGFLGMNN